MVENKKGICNACGYTSVPEGARFCPNCGQSLAGSDNIINNNHHNEQPPMAAAVPVVIDEEPNIAVTATTTTTSADYVSTVTTDAALGCGCDAGRPHQPGTLSAMYFKNPSIEMIQQASSASAVGGVLFIEMSASRGKYTVPKSITAGQVLNGQKIDLSLADFIYPTVTISVGSVLSGLKVIVPRGVRVEVKGLGILGGFKGLSDGQNIHAGQDAPTVLIQGISILGGVKVRVNTDVPPVRVIP